MGTTLKLKQTSLKKDSARAATRNEKRKE